MELSLFLGKVIGVYLLVVGLAYLIRQGFLQEVVREFVESPALIAFGGIVALILGLLLIFGHNVWEVSWRVTITVIGYVCLVKGLFNLFYPEWGRYISNKFREKHAYNVVGIVALAVGLYLMYSVFSLSSIE